MRVIEALAKRKSTRAFIDKSVDIEQIERILKRGGQAPSGTNTQPWQVAVVMGETKLKLQQKLESEFRTGKHGKMDYRYYPKECFLICGMALGYEDSQAPVNSYRTPREETETFTLIFD